MLAIVPTERNAGVREITGHTSERFIGLFEIMGSMKAWSIWVVTCGFI